MNAATPADFDPVVHAPKRLVALAMLDGMTEIEFSYLRDRLGLSDSDLSKQMSTLVDSNLVEVRKTGHGRKSTTWFALTPHGRSAYGAHVAALHELINHPNAGGITMITYDSPVGTLHLARTDIGLVRVGFDHVESANEFAADVHERVGDRVHETATGFDTIRRQFDEYFAGDRTQWDLTIDWQLITGFRRDALQAAFAIPCGEVRSYGELAEDAGSPKASRAVGTAMSSNPIPVVLPCHRIVKADRSIGNYLGGTEAKEALLQLEGAL